MKQSYILFLFLMLPFLFACNTSKNTLLRVNSETVSSKEFQDRIAEASYYYNKDFLNSEQGKNQILDGVIKETVMLELAKKKGYNKTDDYKVKFKNFEKQTLITELIKNLREKELKVSDDDVKKEYSRNKDYYDAPKEIKVAHILVNKKEDADKILNQLKSGVDFSVLASSYSLDTSSAKNGGELDWFGKGDMVPEFEVVAYSIKNIGDISDIVKTSFGYHIIKKINERIGKPISFEDIKAKLTKVLEKQKFDDWFETQKKTMNVKVNDKLLKNINTENLKTENNIK